MLRTDRKAGEGKKIALIIYGEEESFASSDQKNLNSNLKSHLNGILLMGEMELNDRIENENWFLSAGV